MKQDGMSDSDFLRSLAYNDYNIDGHLLSDGDRLCAISDRLELFEKTVQQMREDMLDNLECARAAISRLHAEGIEARKERDEARRMVCGLDADIMEDQVEYARHRGWDCFKEDTK